MSSVGINENGEFVEVTRFRDKTVYVTYQNNGWIRTNIYWDDGTYEELYKFVKEV